jgi:hypothetical protein
VLQVVEVTAAMVFSRQSLERLLITLQAVQALMVVRRKPPAHQQAEQVSEIMEAAVDVHQQRRMAL